MPIIFNLILCIITPPSRREDLFMASGYDDLLAQCHDSEQAMEQTFICHPLCHLHDNTLVWWSWPFFWNAYCAFYCLNECLFKHITFMWNSGLLFRAREICWIKKKIKKIKIHMSYRKLKKKKLSCRFLLQNIHTNRNQIERWRGLCQHSLSISLLCVINISGRIFKSLLI